MLNISQFLRIARGLRDDFGPGQERVSALALDGLIRSTLERARDVRLGLSQDVYLRRGMQGWDRNMRRMENRLRHVMAPTLDAPTTETLIADVIRPILEGVWPAWMSELPQYRDGVARNDPLFTPNTKLEMRGGARHIITPPMAFTAVSLWNQAHVAADFDVSLTSPRFREVLTMTAAAFEFSPEGSDEATVWAAMRRLIEDVGKAAGDAADAAADAAGGLFSSWGPAHTFAAGGLAVLGVMLLRKR